MSKKILYFSRPLTKVLDEANKALVYRLVTHLKQNITIITTNDFTFKVPDNISISKLNYASNFFSYGKSRSFIQKLILYFHYMKIKGHDSIHFFFIPNFSNALMANILIKLRKYKYYLNLATLTERSLKNCFVRNLLRNSESIIVYTDRTKILAQQFNNHVIKIPLLVDSEKFQPMSANKKKELRSKLNLKDSFTVIFPGDFALLNTINELIEIVKTINEQHKEIQFLFTIRINQFDKKAKEQEKQLKAALQNCNVIFKNTVKNIEEYLSASNVCLYIAHLQKNKIDIPLILIEAIVSGLPLVLNNSPYLRENFQMKKGISLHQTPKEFISEIIKLYTDQIFYENSIKDILNLKDIYDTKSIIHSYEEIYS